MNVHQRWRRTRRLSHRAVVCCTLLLAIVVQTARAEEEPVVGDALVAASIGDARVLLPPLASDSASGQIVGLVYNGLVKYSPDLKLVGELAESWDVLDDGLEIVFHLRSDVRWHDGAPFTADDVEFTYHTLIDPDVPTPYSSDFEEIESLEVVDPYTVRVRYREAFAPGLASWTMGMLPKHLLEGQSLQRSSLARAPVGTGPFQDVIWSTGEHIMLVANEHYYEHRPFVDRYIYRIIPDQATMFLELRAQGVDTMGLTPLQYTRQTDSQFFQERFRKFRYPSFGYTYIGYNLTDPRFKDVRVRRAINLALDKEEIIQGAILGLGTVCTGPFLPGSWAFNPEVEFAPYDPDAALQLLAEAGWQDSDGDDWLDRDGQRFSFTLLTNQGNDQRQRTAVIVQRRLADIGIEMRIKVVEWSVFISEFIDQRRFEAILLGWSLSLDPDPYDIWHSSKTGEGEFNFVGYQNDNLDRLLEAGRRTFDQEERRRIYHQVHEILYRDQPYTFLYVPDALPIVHARFRGLDPAPIGVGHNMIDWWVPEAEQRYTR